MIKKGLLLFQTPRSDEPASPEIASYVEASQIAIQTKKGIHSDSHPIRRFWDLSKPENRSKVREFNLEKFKDKTDAVVEGVINGGKLKLRVDKENCLFICNLIGIKTIKEEENNEATVRWSKKTVQYIKDKCLQRDVEFIVEKIDKIGIVHGFIFVKGKNLAEDLLENGYAYVDVVGKYGKYLNTYKDL